GSNAQVRIKEDSKVRAQMEYEKILTQIGGFGRAQLMVFLSLSMTSVKAVLDLQLLALMLHVSPFRCAQQNSSGYEPQGFDKACTEFEFENDFIRLTMVKDFQLVCARDIYPTILMSVYFFGDACGMLFATLGDRIGRRTILLVCGCVDIVTTVLPVFTPTVEWQIGARFLKGLASPVYYQGLLLVEELTAAKHRAMLGNLYWLLWCIGYSLCSLIAYLGQEWRIIQLISLAFSSSYILVYFLVPESPRWLVLKGRTKEAGRVFEKMARWNGIRLEDQTNTNTFIIDDVYINTAVSGVLEIRLPYSLAGLRADRGAVRLPWRCPCVAGVAIIAVPHTAGEAVPVAQGKCLLTAAYSAWTSTALRISPPRCATTASYLSAVVAGFLSVISPVINYLSTVAEWLPAVVFGGLTIVSVLSVLCCRRPRTCAARHR
uniref:MFS domain-containing protein n=1 Tax=Macrostomum lignano TaxID=282301 RepID=A0A1I8FQ00_9PLAT